jgi:hypothetical protein
VELDEDKLKEGLRKLRNSRSERTAMEIIDSM